MSSALSRTEVIDRFQSRFDRRPLLVARAPGRVNLIGEHTDYSMLPVLPIAIDRGTYVAALPTDDGRIRACSEQHPIEASIDRRGHPSRGESAPWHGYLAGVLEQLPEADPALGALILVHGDLPSVGGLSSSSALSMALLAALNATWELGLTLDQLVERGIVAERHVGVESGGMDQTVIAHARERTALRIDFAPPSHRPVPLPNQLRVVVAYSGQEAPKGGAVKHRYNARVVSCRLAAALLAHQLGQTVELPPVLAHVAGAPEVDSLAEELPERATPSAMASLLGISAAPLVRLTAGAFDQDLQIPIRSVARHVLGEARRVDQMEQALRSEDLHRVGQLLDASHRSLAEDFGCSTEALDRLCAAMRQAGAAGARLTGAGFGGFALAVAEPDRVAPVIEAAPSTAFEVTASQGLEVRPGTDR